MSNDAETQAPCFIDVGFDTWIRGRERRVEPSQDSERVREAAALVRGDAPLVVRVRGVRDARRNARSMPRMVAKIAAILTITAAAQSSHADPPRAGASTKPDGANSATKAPPTPGRSKGNSGAQAQPPPSTGPALKSEPEGPEVEGKARAQAIFEQAVAAYKDGRYFDAVELFLETNRIYPDSKLCFNIARAYEGLGNGAGALRYYREYLRRTPSAADKPDVEASVRQLELSLSQKGLQQMSVFSTPDAAVLSIDGQPVALTPWTGETWAGRHRVTATHPGYLESQQIVELSAQRAIDVQIELRPEPPARPVAPTTQDQRPEQGRSVEVLTVTTLAAGAVLLGSALAVQMSNSDSGVSRTAAFLAGTGVGATTVGGVLLYFDLSGRSK